MSHQEIAKFLSKMKENIGDLSQFFVLPVGETISLLTEEGKDFYRQFIDEFDIIIIDTLGASTHTSLSDEEAAREIVDFFNELKKHVTLLIVHHDSKGNSGGRTEDAYGSRLFVDRASTVLRLSKPTNKNDEGIDLTFSKIRLAPEPAPIRLQRSDSLWYTSADFGVVIKETKKNESRSKPRLDDDLF